MQAKELKRKLAAILSVEVDGDLPDPSEMNTSESF